MWDLFKVNNKDSRTTSVGFIVNIEEILQTVLVFALLTWKR